MSGDCVYYDCDAQACNMYPSHLGCCGYEENCYRAYQPRPKKKVTKTVEAWACVDVTNTIYFLHRDKDKAADNLYAGNYLVPLTGTYEVEE